MDRGKKKLEIKNPFITLPRYNFSRTNHVPPTFPNTDHGLRTQEPSSEMPGPHRALRRDVGRKDQFAFRDLF